MVFLTACSGAIGWVERNQFPQGWPVLARIGLEQGSGLDREPRAIQRGTVSVEIKGMRRQYTEPSTVS